MRCAAIFLRAMNQFSEYLDLGVFETAADMLAL